MTDSDLGPREAMSQRLARERRAGRFSPLADYLAAFPDLPEAEVVAGWEAARAPSHVTEVGAEAAFAGAGASLAGFTLLRELGRGGQAAVWLARRGDEAHEVALKILEPGATPRSLELFRREAAIAASLEHPNVCPVLDSGIDEGVAWIAMPHVEGATLAAALSGERLGSDEATLSVEAASHPGPDAGESATPTSPPPLPDAARVRERVRQIEAAARALHACHEAGVVHRDVKPANLMITPAGEPVILDFGLAREEEDSGRTVTLTGELFGTPAYVSPEQLAVKRIRLDRRTDVYSLGASLYEALTLQRPFEAPTRDGLYQAIMTKEPADPRRRNPAVPRDLAVVILRALEKDRDRRHPTAARFADDLAAVLEGRRVSVRAPGPGERLGRFARREPALAALLAALLISLPIISTLLVKRAIDAPLLERRRLLDLEVEKDESLALANLAQDEGRIDEARRLFERALDMEGGSPEAAAALIAIYRRLGETRSAWDLLEELPMALRRTRAVLSMESGMRRERGEEAQAEALAKALPPPTETIDLLLTAAAMCRAAERQAPFRERRTARHALLRLQQGLARLQRPRLAWISTLAHLAGHAQDADAARIAIDALDAHWPRSRAAREWAGFAAMRLEWHEAAERQARAAIALAPSNSRAQSLLGYALHRQGRWAEALPPLREAIRLAPDEAEPRNLLGLSLNLMGRIAEARSVLADALEREPDNPKAHNILADLLADQEEFDLAIRHYRKALARVPWDAVSWSNLGETLRQKGDLDEAIEALRRATGLDRDFAGAHANLAVALNDRGDRAEAEREARWAVHLATANPSAFGILARIERENGRRDASLATADRGLRRFPKDATLHRERGITLRQLKRTDEAIASFRRALEVRPDDAAPWCDIGLTLGDVHRLEEAEVAFRKALALHGEYPGAYAGLGNVAWHRSDYAAAARHYARAVELTPGESEYLTNYANSLRRQGRTQEGIDVLKRRVALEPDDDVSWVNIGIHHFRRREYAEAEAAYAAAEKAAPKSRSVHYHRGILLGATGRTDAAIAAYRRAIACDPEYAEPHCNLASLLEARGELDEALRLMQRGHHLGSERDDWRYRSGQWVRRIEGRLVERDRVREVLDGTRSAPRGERLARLAQTALRIGLPTAAAHWFHEAFRQEPSLLAHPVGVRITATQAALEAARAWSTEDQAPDGDPAAWRARALRWMRDELDALVDRRERGRLSEERFDKTLGAWERYPFLAPVRDAEALAALPEEEAANWRAFWARCAER